MMPQYTAPKKAQADAALGPFAAEDTGLVLGNMPADDSHADTHSHFGCPGPGGAATSAAVDFIYTGPGPARLRRISLPLLLIEGSPQAIMRLIDIGRNTLVAAGVIHWQQRPQGQPHLVHWSRHEPGDGIFVCDCEGLKPYHHYRLGITAQALVAEGRLQEASRWGWMHNTRGDTSGHVCNDHLASGLAPAWRIELKP